MTRGVTGAVRKVESSLTAVVLTKAQVTLLGRLARKSGAANITGGPGFHTPYSANWPRVTIAKLKQFGFVTTTPGVEGRAPTIAITPAGREALAHEKDGTR